MQTNAQCKLFNNRFVDCEIVKSNVCTYLVRLKDGNVIKRRKRLVTFDTAVAKPGLLKRLKKAVIG